MLETFVLGVEAFLRDPAATSSSNPGASSFGASKNHAHENQDRQKKLFGELISGYRHRFLSFEN